MQQYPQQPQPQPYPQQMGYPPQMPQPQKKNFFRTIPGIITGLIIACCVISAIAVAASKGGDTASGNSGNSGNTTTQSTSAPGATATPTHVLKWTTIQSFSGNGSKKTATFNAPDHWRIVWSCDPSSFYGGQYNVIVDVDNSDGTYLDPAAVNTICKSGNTSDNTEEHQGGDVYLDVNSEGAWTMQVQVLK